MEFSPGLRGVVAGETSISTVGKEGTSLRYRGYDATDLTKNNTYEQVASLIIADSLNDKDFKKVLLIDDLSDTGLTLNKSIEWLKNYPQTKDFIKEVKTACLWKKKSSTFEPDFCPVRLDSDPWIVQPTEHYEELSIEELIKRN